MLIRYRDPCWSAIETYANMLLRPTRLRHLCYYAIEIDTNTLRDSEVYAGSLSRLGFGGVTKSDGLVAEFPEPVYPILGS